MSTTRFPKWLKIDALNRSWRTILQGIAASALGAAGDVLIQALSSKGLHDWREVVHTALYAAGTAAVMAVLAYLHRAKLDPSSIPSAQPPGPPIGQAPATTPSPTL